MNLNQLYYFRKLAELEHYTKAAKELYITQPSLSDSISQLEQELGVPLFQREGRRIKITKYGKDFYHYVCACLHQLEIGISNAKEFSGEVGGTIDIGCIPTLIGDFLPNAISGYNAEKNSKAKFNVYHGMTLSVIEGVKNGTYDLGFCSKVDYEPCLAFVPILSQEIILIVNKDHPLANTSYLELNQAVIQYPSVTYRESLPIGKAVRKLLTCSTKNISFSFDDEITIGGYVCQNSVVAIVADTPFLRQFNCLHYIRTDAPKDARLVYMVYNKENYISAAVETFADYIVASKMKLPN